MLKKILLVCFVSVLFMSQSIHADATTVTPECGQTTISNETGNRWSDTQYYSIHVSSSGNTITSLLSVVAYNTNTSISGMMYLERYDGGTWKCVKFWAISGKGKVSISKTYNGTNGKKYRARFVIRVGSDNISDTSNEITL
ncbi:MAG: hypothetical protein IK016_05120 [Lachnospiraceae bacterium]|nr:hypothetical protein [Lachnospiraceae bacterium]